MKVGRAGCRVWPGKVAWGLCYSRRIQFDWNEHIFTHLYFQTHLVKDTELNWIKWAISTRAEPTYLGLALTLISGIFTGQQPHMTICTARILADWKKTNKNKTKPKQRLYALQFRRLFTYIERFCFLSQLSTNNIKIQSGNESQSRVSVIISLKSISFFYFLLT